MHWAIRHIKVLQLKIRKKIRYIHLKFKFRNTNKWQCSIKVLLFTGFPKISITIRLITTTVLAQNLPIFSLPVCHLCFMVRPFCNIIMKSVYFFLMSLTLPLAFSIHISFTGWRLTHMPFGYSLTMLLQALQHLVFKPRYTKSHFLHILRTNVFWIYSLSVHATEQRVQGKTQHCVSHFKDDSHEKLCYPCSECGMSIALKVILVHLQTIIRSRILQSVFQHSSMAYGPEHKAWLTVLHTCWSFLKLPYIYHCSLTSQHFQNIYAVRAKVHFIASHAITSTDIYIQSIYNFFKGFWLCGTVIVQVQEWVVTVMTCSRIPSPFIDFIHDMENRAFFLPVSKLKFIT